MGKWFYGFILLGLVYVGFLVGCQPIKEKPVTSLDQVSLDKVGAGDLPVPPQRKIVATIIRSLFYSNQIFSEAWRLLIGINGVTPSSAMNAVGQRLQNHLGPGQSLLFESKSCPEDHQILEMNPSEANQIIDIRISQLNCATNSKIEIAQIRWEEARGPGFRMTVHPAQIPEGVGDSLVLLNRDITCEFTLGQQERITRMQCFNLGQGLERASHVAFSQFEYGQNQQDLLVVEADRYKNLLEKVSCNSKDPCLKLKVPLEGRIKIIQNQKTDSGGSSEKNQQNQKQKQNQKQEPKEIIESGDRQRGPQLITPSDSGEEVQLAEPER